MRGPDSKVFDLIFGFARALAGAGVDGGGTGNILPHFSGAAVMFFGVALPVAAEKGGESPSRAAPSLARTVERWIAPVRAFLGLGSGAVARLSPRCDSAVTAECPPGVVPASSLLDLGRGGGPLRPLFRGGGGVMGRNVRIEDTTLFREMWEAGASTALIAARHGVIAPTVIRAADRYGYPARSRLQRELLGPMPKHPAVDADASAAVIEAVPDIGQTHPKWTVDQDIAVLRTQGRYQLISELAEAANLPHRAVMQRWHQLRAQA